MQAHHQSLTHPDSPETLNQQHITPHDPIYSQNPIFLPDNIHNIHPDYIAEHESRKFQQHQQQHNNNFNRATSFNQFNATRTRHQAARSGLPPTNSFRETTSYLPTSTPEVFSPILTSPVQQHMPAFEPRASYDFNGQFNLNNLTSKPFMDVFPAQNVHPPHQVNGNKAHQQQQQPQHATYPYPSAPHLSSQTPYGPHVPTAPSASAAINGSNVNASLVAPPGLAPQSQNPSSVNPSSSSGNEEISTIFVVGFPEDMQEREFQNMFTFCHDFEAATLKIPNKEFTAYGGITGGGPAGSAAARNGYSAYSGANDPYNIVTVHQGGVVVDGGRDGTMASWPANVPGDEVNGPFGGAGNAQGINMPPRKQIIGFAKFKTRDAALLARDGLQGRRVDIDKGAVLKAEMAKKNLHTKRGVGPVPGGATSTSTTVATSNALPGTAAIQQTISNGAGGANEPFTVGQNEALAPRDRDLGGLGGLGNSRLNQWREQPQPQQDLLHSSAAGVNGVSEREEEERRVTMNNAINLVGLNGFGTATRGPRERAEEDERERRRKDKDMRLRSGNMSAYDAFHSVPAGTAAPPSQISRQLSSQGLPSTLEHELAAGASSLTNGFANGRPVQEDELPGPWDNIRGRGVPIPHVPTQRSSSPSLQTNGSAFEGPPRSFSPPELNQFNQMIQQARHEISLRKHASSESSSSSVVGGPQSVGNHSGSDWHGSDADLARALGGLDVNAEGGKTSPQLPSPASGASSRNGIDQNPPINTLYVGNLPTSSPPNGYPQDYLEDSLRELFAPRPGFRRLCFRQKSNGPMCFVEFEDVPHATRALNELYGDTLKGLVKGGIRLSYSKNPLGVRTPTSAGSNGSSLLQQQQMQGNGISTAVPPSASAGHDFQSRKDEQQTTSRLPQMILRRDVSVASPQPPSTQSPFTPDLLATSPPPPRFFSSSPSGFAASSGAVDFTGIPKSFMPRYTLGMPSGVGHGPPPPFAPFGLSSTPPPHSIPDHQPDGHLSSSHQHFHNNFAPASNLEAARAG